MAKKTKDERKKVTEAAGRFVAYLRESRKAQQHGRRETVQFTVTVKDKGPKEITIPMLVLV